MQEFDVVIFSNDKYLRSALCEEVRLMGYSCGFDSQSIRLGGVVVYDLSVKENPLPIGNAIIYIADKENEESTALPKGAPIFTRPFSLEDFSRTLQKLIKKFDADSMALSDPNILIFDTFLLVCGKRIDLTDNEMLIFRALWDEEGKAVNRKQLEKLTGANGDGNMVAVYISRLRSKLEDATDKRMILTVRDVGYRLAR